MKKKKSARKAPTNRDDSCLKAFCDSVHLEDISLEQWETCQAALDITVPLFLTPAEASAGLQKELRYSRSITDSPDSPPRRQAAQCLVSIPPQALDGLQLCCPGLGDTLRDRHGDLLVIVRIKRGT